MEINQEHHRNEQRVWVRVKKINSKGIALASMTWQQLTHEKGWRFIWPWNQDEAPTWYDAKKADVVLGSALQGTPWEQNPR